MKKFQTNKRNPNPPWPDEMPVVVVPPGNTAESVGLNGQQVYKMQTGGNYDNVSGTENEDMSRDGDFYPIMGMMQRPTDNIFKSGEGGGGNMMPEMMPSENAMTNGAERICGSAYINGYLCGHTGRYVRLEFMFGEQNHVEKTGMLREVGKNYIVMQEMGTDTMVVCPLDKIKFINIYNVNNNQRRM